MKKYSENKVQVTTGKVLVTKVDVDTLEGALSEFLLATNQKKDLKSVVKEMRECGEAEKEISIALVSSALDKVAYGN